MLLAKTPRIISDFSGGLLELRVPLKHGLAEIPPAYRFGESQIGVAALRRSVIISISCGETQLDMASDFDTLQPRLRV